VDNFENEVSRARPGIDIPGPFFMPKLRVALGKIAYETATNPLGACAGWAMATILVVFAFLAAIGRLDLVPDLVRTIGNVVGVS